ncbi:MAG: phosphatidyl inositol kinase [Chaenotheca gracillima]|nr:MAG: phosphatidyl inositol kinase [Chaenotheca gracillima]
MSTSADHANVDVQPICQNCTTSTTPLWRRDEIGSVLCNACGLFLKLHGRPRPISLKTDVIKSRNRVKSSGQGQKKKNLFDGNGISSSRSDAGTPPPGSMGHRRTSQKTSSGTSNGSNSPLSRTATPANHHGNHLAPQHVFDGASLSDHGFHHSPSLPSLHLSHPSPGSTSSLNDRHLEPPQTYEALHAANTSLKTRVSELEVINDLFQGRVKQLEQNEDRARRDEAVRRDLEEQLRSALDQTQRRESNLKRRVDDLERELSELRDSGPRPKKMRVSDIVDDRPIDSTPPPPLPSSMQS